MTGGYTSTPLARKLGMGPGTRLTLFDAPPGFTDMLAPLPDGATTAVDDGGTIALAILFARQDAGLRAAFDSVAARLTPAGALWVAWPKKAAKVPTDLDFAAVQRVGLEAGLVDTKVCAVDDVWSGLRFVRRVMDRR
jgi:hypothetical protein